MRKHISRPILLLCIILLSSYAVDAAVISGKIYDMDLEAAADVIVEINSTPLQKVVSKDGSYQFDVEPGNYAIAAVYYDGNLLEAFSSETIRIYKEGEYSLDMILFPYLGDDESLAYNMGIDIPERLVDDLPDTSKKEALGGLIVLLIAVIVAIIAAIFIFRPKRPQTHVRIDPVVIKDELDRIVSILKRQGGRATQKEIRKVIPFSEAKISLMIAELESKGIVEKIKKGRGNIIILKSK